MSGTTAETDFVRFVKETEPKLSYALYAAYGPEVGAEVTAEALGYAWEHWDRVRKMDNRVGYLYRVAQSRARWYRRPQPAFPATTVSRTNSYEPALAKGLEQLTKNQRIAVVLIYVMQWTEAEVATLIGRSRSTVRTHLERGLARLRTALEVSSDV